MKEVCRNIAADEFRHYKLFYTYLLRYLEVEKIGSFGRFLAAASRIRESEDDELAYAYYAANHPVDAVYERKRFVRAYLSRAYGFYRRPHIERGIGMILKAIGLTPNGRLNAVLTRWISWLLRLRVRRAVRVRA